MTLTSFNLLSQPWIRVRLLGGGIVVRSVRGALDEAHAIRSLAGEIPSQDAAVLRVLLAVLLGASRPSYPRSDSEALDLWERWWNAGNFPAAELDSYLQPLSPRFDLLHPTMPFFQASGLTTKSGKTSGLGKLIADLPDGSPYFTTRAGKEVESLSLAEAARWIVHCQAFDASGIKTGAEGDDRVKDGKGFSFGYPAWSGNLGLVILEGSNLFETLMLNLPLLFSGFDDLPVWERQPLTPAVEQPIRGNPVDDDGLRLPLGPADLFTWPSRRIRLFVRDDQVVDVQISNGDKRGPQNLRKQEPMCAWRRSENQSKNGQDVLMPVTHDPARQMWQGLGSLLQSRESGDKLKRAASLDLVDHLVENDQLPRERLVDLRIVGLEYGPQNSTITGAVDDRLTAPVAALSDDEVTQAAVDAAEAARQGVIALANFAGDLDRAAGGDGTARSRTFEYGYALLDAPYRVWIRTLSVRDQIAQQRTEWAETARRILLQAATSLVINAGPAAIVGRKVSQPGRDEKVQLDAGVAESCLRFKLLQAFPSSQQKDTER